LLRPHILENCNQVFARDVAFVIDDVLIVSNIIPDRADETEAYLHILNRIRPKKILLLPDRVHIEGGDVVLYNDIIFLGVYTEDDYPSFKTARTNRYAIDFLRSAFPHKEVVAIELKKHDTDPAKGILHLDCTFMPVAGNRAIIYSQGFANQRHYAMLLEIFGADNIFEITCREMVDMNSNIFSISPKTVISEQRFTRLNRHLTENWQIEVEAIPYYEISKMGGLLRCSTLPLVREKQPAQHQ
jgi:N-dimethylarginine dimethylaminohydrolase